MSQRIASIAALWMALLIASCSTNRDVEDFFAPQDAGTLVIDGLLKVGRPFAAIRVSRVLSATVEYSITDAAESNATVYIQEVASGRRFDYHESQFPGLYAPDDPFPVVGAGTTYRLFVTTQNGQQASAQTTTPALFRVDRWVLLRADESVEREFATFEEAGSNVYFLESNQVIYAQGFLEAQFQRPSVDAFQVGVFSLDPDSDFVIDPDFFEPEDFAQLDRATSSPALEGANGTLRLPWFSIFFAGRYDLTILALDRNAYDFVRSIPQDGAFAFGGTLGDQFERPIFHVDGGIGLFGSASSDTLGLFVLPRPTNTTLAPSPSPARSILTQPKTPQLPGGSGAFP